MAREERTTDSYRVKRIRESFVQGRIIGVGYHEIGHYDEWC
jgi:hypothetical protein